MPLKMWILSSVMSTKPLIRILSQSFMPKITQNSYFSPGQTRGDSVTQLGGQVTLSEKAAVTITCTYSAPGYTTLFWYVHYSREGPQLLLEATKDKEKESAKSLKPHTTEHQNPYTWRKPQSRSQTRLCTTVLRNTEKGTAGGANAHSEQQWGLDVERLTLWSTLGPSLWCSVFQPLVDTKLIQMTRAWEQDVKIPHTQLSLVSVAKSLTPIVPCRGLK